MILVDKDYKDLLASDQIIHKANPKNINPASLDLTLSDCWLDLYDNHKKTIQADTFKLYPNNLSTGLINWILRPFGLRRTTLLLASTVEVIDLPSNMWGMVKMKTTPCREGLGHPIADWVDPGFCGQLTLMLHAFKPITLSAGARICQIVIGYLGTDCEHPYGQVGHYQGQSGPTLSWRQAAFKQKRRLVDGYNSS